MDDIKAVVQRCDKCQKSRPAQPKQPIMQMNKATYAMQVVGTDLFQLGGKHYIVVVDQYSGFPMAGQFSTPPSSTTVLNHLEHWFNLFGVPEAIVSDNGPQYSSDEYDEYAKERNIRLIHSSPYHSSGNGLAEAAVRNIKELLKKYEGNWKKFQRGLMLWRNMPNKSGKSPAEMFLGHRQRTILPLLPGQYDFQIEDAIKAAEKRKKIRSE